MQWIKVVTKQGYTRIRLDSICAYQLPRFNADQLRIYTSDDTMFEVIEDYEGVLKMLDAHFVFYTA